MHLFATHHTARAYLKCVKGHGGYNACERCTIIGEHIKEGKFSKIIYPDLECQPRTNLSFLTQEDRAHHTGISPLINIVPQVDLTKIFVLDHMHLFFNGIMKTLIHFWMRGPLKVRLTPKQKIEISRRLLHFTTYISIEFQRAPRTLF